MRILLLDTTAYSPASPLFVEALEELVNRFPESYEYTFLDEAQFDLSSPSLLVRALGYLFKRRRFDVAGLNRTLISLAISYKPDVVLISKGALILPETLVQIKRNTGAVIVNYATDDPFNRRVSTEEMRGCIPLYDVYACTKRAIMDDVAAAGCGRVIYIPFGYKPQVHFPELASSLTDKVRFDCDVAFIGGCDSERSVVFDELIKILPNLDLRLYGAYWNRHHLLKRYWRGFAIGRDFRLAVSGAKVSLNLVRRANRDGHVMRTFELPACKGFMLAERTIEHTEFFREEEEVVCFDSVCELAEKVIYYVDRPAARDAIAQRGHLKTLTGGHTYTHRLFEIFSFVKQEPKFGLSNK